MHTHTRTNERCHACGCVVCVCVIRNAFCICLIGPVRLGDYAKVSAAKSALRAHVHCSGLWIWMAPCFLGLFATNLGRSEDRSVFSCPLLRLAPHLQRVVCLGVPSFVLTPEQRVFETGQRSASAIAFKYPSSQVRQLLTQLRELLATAGLQSKQL